MDVDYEAHGIRFRYPEHWELSEQHTGTEAFITVSSPETAFWSLSLLFERPEPEYVVSAAVETFRDEYDDLDEYESSQQLASFDAAARDLEFVCLELLNSAFLRAIRTERFTALVLYQANDDELEETGDVFRRISESLAVVEGEAP